MSPWLSDVPNALADNDAASVVFSASSTNITEDNLPGAGRTLGNLYRSGGKRFEKAVGKLALKAGYDFQARSSKLDPVHNAEGEAKDSDCSVSTNATDENLPGSGRTIGLIYATVGKSLEKRLGNTAERLGQGPRLTAIRIKSRSSELVAAASASELSPVEVRTLSPIQSEGSKD